MQTDGATARAPRTPQIPTSLVDAWIRARAEKAGKKGDFKITSDMRKLARLEIKRQHDIAVFCGEKD